jgi:hypothetical protein
MSRTSHHPLVAKQVYGFMGALYPDGGIFMLKVPLPHGGLRRALYRLPEQLPLVAEETVAALGWMATTEDANVFFGVHARTVRFPDDGDAVQFIYALVFDIDDKLSKPNATKNLPGRLRLLERHGVRPTFIVLSGSGDGRHVYFLLDRAWPAHAMPNRVRAAMYRLGSWLESDTIYDAYRLMRWPFSANWKSGIAVPLSFEVFEPHRKTSLETVDAALDALGVPMPKLPAKVTGVTATRARSKRHSNSPRRRGDANIVTAAPPSIDFLEPAMCKLVDTGWTPDCGFESPSHLDLRLAVLLVHAGLDDDEVLAVFLRNGVGRLQQKGLEYYQRTLAAAKEPASGVERYGAVIERSKADPNRDWVRMRVLGGSRDGTLVDARMYRDSAKHAQWMAELRVATGEPRSSAATVEALRGRHLTIEVVRGSNGTSELKHFVPRRIA